MKDNRFIELVNLYIDRQITAVEAADLEAEMQASPRRRAIYREYCKMHRATTLVYDSFRTETPGEESTIGASRAPVARFETPQHKKRINWNFYAGGLVAACVALVFVSRNFSTQADPVSIAALGSKPKTAAIAGLVVAPVAPVTKQAMENPLVVATASRVTTPAPAVEKDYAAMLTALRQEEQRAFASSQLSSGHLPSLFEDGVFDSRQELPGTSQRIFRGKQSTSPQTAEFTAFQFQR